MSNENKVETYAMNLAVGIGLAQGKLNPNKINGASEESKNKFGSFMKQSKDSSEAINKIMGYLIKYEDNAKIIRALGALMALGVLEINEAEYYKSIDPIGQPQSDDEVH